MPAREDSSGRIGLLTHADSPIRDICSQGGTVPDHTPAHLSEPLDECPCSNPQMQKPCVCLLAKRELHTILQDQVLTGKNKRIWLLQRICVFDPLTSILPHRQPTIFRLLLSFFGIIR